MKAQMLQSLIQMLHNGEIFTAGALRETAGYGYYRLKARKPAR